MGPIGGGGGGGGGGSTTPNPPGGYDPCEGGGNIPTASYRAPSNGLKLMGVPPSPCDDQGGGTGGGLPPLVDPDPMINLIESLIDELELDNIHRIFLLNNNNIALAVNQYLQTYGRTTENKNFGNWGIDFLTKNSTEDKATFIKNFFTSIEIKDSETDDNTWYQNTVQQQQQLPSKIDYYNSYPKKIENGYIYGLKSADVYTIVGGSLDAKNKAGNPDYQNACAIRGSRALNYAGIAIPVVVYDNKKKTEQGADGKNYILSATAFRRFMNEKFGNATYKLTSQQIGNDKSKIVDFLKGKTGIFVVTNMYPGTAGYSGHVDYIINGACINGSNINPKGGIEKIEIWELN